MTREEIWQRSLSAYYEAVGRLTVAGAQFEMQLFGIIAEWHRQDVAAREREKQAMCTCFRDRGVTAEGPLVACSLRQAYPDVPWAQTAPHLAKVETRVTAMASELLAAPDTDARDTWCQKNPPPKNVFPRDLGYVTPRELGFKQRHPGFEALSKRVRGCVDRLPAAWASEVLKALDELDELIEYRHEFVHRAWMIREGRTNEVALLDGSYALTPDFNKMRAIAERLDLLSRHVYLLAIVRFDTPERHVPIPYPPKDG